MNKLLLSMSTLAAMALSSVHAQVTPVSQMEKLDRGIVAIPTGYKPHFISWRLLGTENPKTTTFDLIRDGEVIAQNLKVTNYRDDTGSPTAKYQVVTKVNGTVKETATEVTPWSKKFLTLTLDRPATGKNGGTYTPNDMSVGDVDGDGQYELFVKWDPSNSHDNSEDGITDNVYIDCYKLDGTKLWRVDLGPNIRAGAHYTQFLVYDFNKDGKAEMMCRTANASKDGGGNYVNQAATDQTISGHTNSKEYRNSKGHIISGPEYLTVFDGKTGKAIHTTWYLPGRAGTGSSKSMERGDELGTVSDFPSGFWGDNNGNRSERYLAGVAYINGADQPACGIFTRGYYTKAYAWAVSFDGERLHTEWLHASPNGTQSLVFASKWNEGQAGLEYTIDGDHLKRIPATVAPANTGGVKTADSSTGIAGSNTLYGNGNHNLSIADVDGDGCDEIIWGAAALDNNGKLLYATGYGHGDAIHVGKMMPDREGLQVFDVHEEKLTAAHGSWDLHDAATGEIIWHGGNAGVDNGRGLAADIVTDKRGYEFWSGDNDGSYNSRTPRNAVSGAVVLSSKSLTSSYTNFRIYWDETPYDQLFDGKYDKETTTASPKIEKLDGNSWSTLIDFGTSTYNNGQTCNTTKATPCLQADILGDWREELILWNKENPAEINIYSTWKPTEYAVPTLMHDHTYRMGVAWQNTAYNQPPHLGYYLPDYIDGKLQPAAIMGDVNNDSTVDVEDVVAVVNHILGTAADGFVEKNADINGDGVIDVDDVVGIVNMILKQ